MKTTASHSLVWGAALSCCACIGPERTLEPAPSVADSSDHPSAVSQSREGVRATAHVEAWYGDTVLRDQLTPILVTIHNARPEPVQLNLENLSLVGASGRIYRAERPGNLSGTARQRDREAAYPPSTGELGSYAFSAPYGYSTVHPSIGTGNAYLPPGPQYGGAQYGTWTSVELPTKEMLRVAMTEGELAPGEQESGFVYFERLAREEKRFTLQLDLIATQRDGRLRPIRMDFPFVVRD